MNPPTWYKTVQVGVYYRGNSVQLVGLKENIYCARIWARTIKNDQKDGNSNDCNPEMYFKILLPDSKVTAREMKKDENPVEVAQEKKVESFNLNVSTFFHNSAKNNQLCLKEVSCTSTIKALKEIVLTHIETECEVDATNSWTPWTLNLFDEKYSTLYKDNVELRGCLKDGMTINVVINRISLDVFPKIDDIRWPPVTSLNDEVIYFVSAGFGGRVYNTYTGYLHHHY